MLCESWFLCAVFVISFVSLFTNRTFEQNDRHSSYFMIWLGDHHWITADSSAYVYLFTDNI